MLCLLISSQMNSTDENYFISDRTPWSNSILRLTVDCIEEKI